MVIDILERHLLCAGKLDDLLAHNVNSAVIAGVQLQNRVPKLSAKHAPRTRQNSARLSRAARPVQQQVRHAATVDEFHDCLDDFLVRHQLVNFLRPILFHPRQRVLPLNRMCRLLALLHCRHFARVSGSRARTGTVAPKNLIAPCGKTLSCAGGSCERCSGSRRSCWLMVSRECTSI